MIIYLTENSFWKLSFPTFSLALAANYQEHKIILLKPQEALKMFYIYVKNACFDLKIRFMIPSLVESCISDAKLLNIENLNFVVVFLDFRLFVWLIFFVNRTSVTDG